MTDSMTIDGCRSCGGTDLREILDLGETPLANRLLDPDELAEPEPCYRLRVVFCPACSLVQIDETVAPEVLFSDYLYYSSFSDAFVEHSRRHVENLVADLALGPESRVIEIASNDGYLLQHLLGHGVPVLGIEPAADIAEAAREKGVPTRTEFFGHECAERLVAEGQLANVVLGNNVLAHVSDLNGFVAGVALLLRPEGIAEFEFPYLGDLVENVEFDTIYHEHLCYFSAHAFATLFERHGLAFADVRRLPVHGGSLRVRAARAADGEGRQRVEQLLAEERARGMDRLDFYRDFGGRVESLKQELAAELGRLKQEGRRMVAYGASAKGSTLLNYVGIGSELLDYVVDRSTVKQGRYTPGTHLEICHVDRLCEDRPDYALLLTWNFADEILAQQAEYRRAGGHFIIPIPTVRVV